MEEIYIWSLKGLLFIVIYIIPLYLLCILWFWMSFREWIEFRLSEFLAFLSAFVWLGLTYRIWAKILNNYF